MRHGDAHIDASLSRRFQSPLHFITDDQIGSMDVNIMSCLIDDVEVNGCPNFFLIRRTVGKRLDITVADRLFLRLIDGPVIVVIARRHRLVNKIPELQKHDGQAPDRIAFEHHSGVFPMPVFLIGIDILICQVDASDKPDLAVDHTDFAVITVVHLNHQLCF